MLSSLCPVCQHNSLQYDTERVKCTVCKTYSKPLPWYLRPYIWARGKSWWWRLLILLWVLYTFWRYVHEPEYPIHRMANIVNAIDFGIHELGHLLFIPFGEFMTILGGSLFQTIFPLLWLGALFWKRWYFAASLCFIWVGLNLYDVAVYVADARTRTLPLATFATDYDSAHDWYQLLSRLDRLSSDLAIAGQLRLVGAICVIIGTVLALSLLLTMAFFKKPARPERPKPKDLKGKPPQELYPTPTRNI